MIKTIFHWSCSTSPRKPIPLCLSSCDWYNFSFPAFVLMHVVTLGYFFISLLFFQSWFWNLGWIYQIWMQFWFLITFLISIGGYPYSLLNHCDMDLWFVSALDCYMWCLSMFALHFFNKLILNGSVKAGMLLPSSSHDAAI